MEQELLQKSWHQGYSWKESGNNPHGGLRNATWRASEPFIALTLKYKIEMPAIGQTAATVIEFCFEPGSNKIFTTRDVTPKEL
jgi:hypothetical protein